MRLLVALLGCAGLASGILLTRGRAPDARARRAADDDLPALDLPALKEEMDALRARVRAAENVSAAALASASSPRRDPAPGPADASGAPEGAPSPAAPRPQVTEEQQVATFHRYFEHLDGIRGSANDVALADRFGAVLSNHAWSEDGASSPASTKVACGNGYCRVSLQFKELKDAIAARSKLIFDFRDVAGDATMFLDPKTARLEGYFATGGAQLPPFPSPEP